MREVWVPAYITILFVEQEVTTLMNNGTTGVFPSTMILMDHVGTVPCIIAA